MTTNADVQRFWQQRTALVPDTRAVTHPDVLQREMEIRAIIPHLRNTDRLLDGGCGTGYATAKLAPYVSSAVGIDYVQEMVDRAKVENSTPNTQYNRADLLQLPFESEFDAALTVRALINILDPAEQRQAIDQLLKSLKPKGRLLIMEGCHDGRSHLSAEREKVGLAPLPNVFHNRDFVTKDLIEYLTSQNCSILSVQYFGLYDFLTRLFLPKLIAPQAPEYNTVFHEHAMETQEKLGSAVLGEYSRLVFVVAQKA